MIVSRKKRRPRPMQHGQALARPCGAGDARHILKNLAARQGCAAFALHPAPRSIGAAAPSNPAPQAKTATPFTPAHSSQGKEFRRFGFGWNHGTGLEPQEVRRNTLKTLMKSETGTVEPWNRQFTTHMLARARALVCMFHGSKVPERDIHREYQSLGQGGCAVPVKFHGSRINNGGEIDGQS